MSQELLCSSSLKDSVADLVGKKYKIIKIYSVNLEIKNEKFEPRLAIATELRLFISKQKPLKLESSFHYADINIIQCHDYNLMTLIVDPSASNNSSRLVRLTSNKDDLSGILHAMFDFYSIVNHQVSFEKRTPKLDLSPDIKKILLDKFIFIENNSYLSSPCGNFTTMYKSKCDQMDLVFLEDIAWDVDTIYNSQNSVEFAMSDFDNLLTKQMNPLVASLEENIWFNKLSLSNIKMSVELGNELVKVLKSNTSLQVLNLSNTGIRSDYTLKLFPALNQASHWWLHSLDLSNNIIEDKGLIPLCSYIAKHPRGLVSLNLSSTSLTFKGINQLGESLSSCAGNKLSLVCLDLSNNLLKGDDLNMMHNFLAQQNHIEHLNISNTDWPLDAFFAAALRGCTQHLKTLNVANCAASKKVSTKDLNSLISWKQFLSSVSCLESVDFSFVKMSPDTLKNILEGLECNIVVDSVKLSLIGCQLGQSPQILSILLQNIESMKTITSLDISENALDQSLTGVLNKLANNKCLKELYIGGNVTSTKPRFLAQLMDALLVMLQDDNNVIEKLSLKNLRLKNDVMVLLDALGTNNTLTWLDISGNNMCDFGAKMLSKALLLNRKLMTLLIEDNQVTHIGLEYISTALEKNTTIKHLPLPVSDIVVACKVNHQATDAAIKKIETSLRRNQSTNYFTDYSSMFKFDQWLSNSFDQELINTNIQELSDIISSINEFSTKQKITEKMNAKLNEFKKILWEAINVKKYFVNTYKFVEKFKEEKLENGKIVHNISVNVADVVKNALNEYADRVESDYSAILTSIFSKKDFALSEREMTNAVKEIELNLTNHMTSLIMSTCYDRAQKFNEGLLNSSLAAVEQAIYNAKSLLGKLIAKRDYEAAGDEFDMKIPLNNVDFDEEDENDELQSLPARRILSHKNKSRPSSLLTSSQESSSNKDSQLDELNNITETTSNPKLTHLCKDRPKRMKNRAPTRPIMNVVEGSGGKSDEERLDSDPSLKQPKQQTLKTSTSNEALDIKSATVTPTSPPPTTPTTKSAKHAADAEPTGRYIKKQQNDVFFNTPTTTLTTNTNNIEKCNTDKTTTSSTSAPVPAMRLKKLAKLTDNSPQQQQSQPNTPPLDTSDDNTKSIDSNQNNSTPSNNNSNSGIAVVGEGGGNDASLTQSAPPTLRKPQPIKLGGGLLVPSMNEIQKKRLTMKHVIDSDTPSEIVAERSKRASEGNLLKPALETMEAQTGGKNKLVPPLPPKPNRGSGGIALKPDPQSEG